MQTAETELLTTRDVCRETGARLHAVKYAISEYDIQPVQRVGNIRLFHRDQTPEIRSALKRIASN